MGSKIPLSIIHLSGGAERGRERSNNKKLPGCRSALGIAGGNPELVPRVWP